MRGTPGIDIDTMELIVRKDRSSSLLHKNYITIALYLILSNYKLYTKMLNGVDSVNVNLPP
jgi:hypothetical protein